MKLNAIVWWIFNSFRKSGESDANMKSYHGLILSLECELIIINIGNHNWSNVVVCTLHTRERERERYTLVEYRIVLCVFVSFVSRRLLKELFVTNVNHIQTTERKLASDIKQSDARLSIEWVTATTPTIIK